MFGVELNWPLVRLENRALGWILLRAAWGPRRVTSKKRYGAVDAAYPPSVAAHWRLWFRWARAGIPRWITGPVQIVIPATKAEKRIQDALTNTTDNPAQPGLSDAEVKRLQDKRAALRNQKRFKEADEIRDKLISMGVVVSDAPIAPPRL